MTEEVISEVYVRRPLWDKTDPMYQNPYVLNELWEEVAVKMKMTNKDVRKKWTNLTKKFRNELMIGETRNSEVNVDDVKQSSWEYFESLSFLKDQFTFSQGSGSLDIPPRVKRRLSSTETASEGPPSQEDGPSATEGPLYTEQASTSVVKRRGNGKAQNLSESRFNHKRQKLLNVEKQGILTIEKDEFDEDESFLKSLLPFMRAHHGDDKIILRMNMLSLLRKSTFRSDSSDSAFFESPDHEPERLPPFNSVFCRPWRYTLVPPEPLSYVSLPCQPCPYDGIQHL